MVRHKTVPRRSCGGVWACLSCLVAFLFGPEFCTEQVWGVQSRLRPSFVAPAGATATAASWKKVGSQVPRRQLVSTVDAAPSAVGLAGCVSVALGLSLAVAAAATRRKAGVSLRAESDSCKGDASITGARATGTDAKAEAAQKESERAELHSMLEELDMKMHLLAQAGDFKSAAKIRDKLGTAQLDDEGSVLLANAEFYAAFTKKDMKRMKALWLPTSYVQCMTPYDKPSHGYTEVCRSFQRLFEPSQKKRTVTPEDVKVNVLGATAIVSCTEQIILQKRPVKVMLTTNIFRKVESRWLLLHRHCSHIGQGNSLAGDESEGAELAMGENALAALRMQQFQQLMRAAKNIGGSQIIIKQANLSDYDEDSDDDDDEDDDVGPFGITGIVNGPDDEEEEEDGSDEELFVEEEDQAAMERSRKSTVRALRKLRAENLISKQGHVHLIQDMLRHPGESIPERAHELLLDGEDSDCPAAWEEFTALMIAEMPGESKRRNQREGRSLKIPRIKSSDGSSASAS